MSTNQTNDQLILVCGPSGSGKTASLRNLENQDKWMFLNCEAGKRPPFKNSFQHYRIEDPRDVPGGFDYAMKNPNQIDGIIIDSLTFLMEMYESKIVLKATNTIKAWSDYNQFFKEILQDKVIRFDKPVIMIAHTTDILDEKAMEYRTMVPVKGALKNQGVEAYFSTVVAAKKVSTKELEEYQNDLLHITDEEKDLGFKYVFQTRITRTTTGERIRSPMGLFDKSQTYIDNDCQVLLNHLNDFYK